MRLSSYLSLVRSWARNESSHFFGIFGSFQTYLWLSRPSTIASSLFFELVFPLCLPGGFLDCLNHWQTFFIIISADRAGPLGFLRAGSLSLQVEPRPPCGRNARLRVGPSSVREGATDLRAVSFVSVLRQVWWRPCNCHDPSSR